MEKDIWQITYTETDNGVRINFTGEKFKEMASCGCIPMMGCMPGSQHGTVCCCTPGHKDDSSCCESGEKKE